MADSHDNSINPLFVGILGVISGAIVVAFINCLVVSCRINQGQAEAQAQVQAQASVPPSRPPNMHQATRGRGHREYNDSLSFTGPSSSSSSSSSVTMLGIHKFSKEFKEGTCAVCLGEFEEEDEVRIMPECAHVFHVACIDMWLFSHTNCPLCRANTTPRGHHVIVSS